MSDAIDYNNRAELREKHPLAWFCLMEALQKDRAPYEKPAIRVVHHFPCPAREVVMCIVGNTRATDTGPMRRVDVPLMSQDGLKAAYRAWVARGAKDAIP